MFDFMEVSNWQMFFTGGLFFVAAFGGRIRAFLFKPKLDFEIHVSPPDCHKVGVGLGGSDIRFFSYYFRIKVKNRGNMTAENVEVFADQLQKFDDNVYRKVDSFLPMNLKWSHTHETFVDKISRDMYRHCDFFHIHEIRKDLISLYKQHLKLEYLDKMNEGVGIISFDLIAQSFNKGHLIDPGKYRIRLSVAGSNAKSKSKTYQIDYGGKWSTNECEIVGNMISISKV